MHSLLFYVFLMCGIPYAGNSAIDNNRLDEVYQKACHNCYEPKYSYNPDDMLDNVKNIEIDFYDSRSILRKHYGARAHKWYVRHSAFGKNKNCYYPSGAGGNDLDACLQQVAAWCKKNPGHDLVSIFLDKKQKWAKKRMPEDLDNLIMKYFDTGMIYKPADLKGQYPTLREAAEKYNNWKTLARLKGKVLFGMTGGCLLNPNKAQAKYIRQRGDKALIFVTPDTKTESDIIEHPHHFRKEDASNIVFYNFKYSKSNLCTYTRERHFMSRVFGVYESNKTKEYKNNYKDLTNIVNYIAVYDYTNCNFFNGIIGE